MKARELLELAEEEIQEERNEQVLEVIKESVRIVEEARRTYKAAKKAHSELLELDVEDIDSELEY